MDIEKEKGDSLEKEEEVKRVSVIEIFKFASKIDTILICIGLIASFVMGAVFPAMIIFYGKVMNTFVQYEISRLLFISNETLVNATATSNTTAPYVDVFYDEVRECCLAFTGLAACGFVISYIMVLCLSYAAKNQTQRIRLKFFESVLKQDMA
ncbi:multidrug resistance protein 1-like protein, partial [Leptotrombidium deliense]